MLSFTQAVLLPTGVVVAVEVVLERRTCGKRHSDEDDGEPQQDEFRAMHGKEFRALPLQPQEWSQPVLPDSTLAASSRRECLSRNAAG